MMCVFQSQNNEDFELQKQCTNEYELYHNKCTWSNLAKIGGFEYDFFKNEIS